MSERAISWTLPGAIVDGLGLLLLGAGVRSPRLVGQGLLQIVAGAAIIAGLREGCWSDACLVPVTLLAALAMLHRWYLRRNNYFVDLGQLSYVGTDIPELLMMGLVGLVATFTLGRIVGVALWTLWNAVLGVVACRLGSIGSVGFRMHPGLYRVVRYATGVAFVVATIWTLAPLREHLIRSLAM